MKYDSYDVVEWIKPVLMNIAADITYIIKAEKLKFRFKV